MEYKHRKAPEILQYLFHKERAVEIDAHGEAQERHILVKNFCLSKSEFTSEQRTNHRGITQKVECGMELDPRICRCNSYSLDQNQESA